MAKVKVNFWFDEVALEHFKEMAVYRRMSLSEWVRQACESQAREDNRMYAEFARLQRMIDERRSRRGDDPPTTL